MGESEIRFLGDVQRLALEPNDIVVLSTEMQLSMDLCVRLRDDLRSILGADRKVIVLTDGMRLGVLAEEKAEGGAGRGT